MKNCIETYKLPAAWASFLINGDSSGTDEEELTAIKAFCRRNGLPLPGAPEGPRGAAAEGIAAWKRPDKGAERRRAGQGRDSRG